MTVIRNNSISGINSITAQSSALNFYDSTGNTLAISADVTGGVTVATGATISGSTNTITASTNGSERVRITSSGNVGIGTDNPGSNKLQVQGGSAFYGNGGASATWGDTSYLGALSFDGSANPLIRAASSKALVFQVNQSTEAARFTSAGNLAFPSGQGIDFSATSTDGATVDSELLSDYEEGEWTPTLGGSGGDATATIGNNRCRYIKIGKLVVAYVDFDATISASGAGQLQVSLPFAVANPIPKPYCEIFGARNCSMIASETYKVTGWTIENSSRATFQLSTGTNGAETTVSWGSNVNTSGTPRLCAAFAYYSTT